MSCPNPTSHDAEPGAPDTAENVYLQKEGAALGHVLILHPATLRLSEIVRELAGPSTEFIVLDDYEQAIKDLIGVGLLFEAGGLIVPTRAALHFHKLQQTGAI